jgi:hypothetical protein
METSQQQQQQQQKEIPGISIIATENDFVSSSQRTKMVSTKLLSLSFLSKHLSSYHTTKQTRSLSKESLVSSLSNFTHEEPSFYYDPRRVSFPIIDEQPTNYTGNLPVIEAEPNPELVKLIEKGFTREQAEEYLVLNSSTDRPAESNLPMNPPLGSISGEHFFQDVSSSHVFLPLL